MENNNPIDLITTYQTANSEKRKRATFNSLLFAFFFLLFALPTTKAATPDGYVVKVESSTVYLDWGQATGVKTGDTFQVYRETGVLKHPVTGEILGKTQQNVGSGMIDHVEEKFSVGDLIEGKGAAAAGDRTRLQASPAAPAPTAIAAPASVSLEPTAPAVPMKEIWRSDALKGEAVGLTLARLDDSSQTYVVIAYRDSIEVFRWAGDHLASVASFRHRTYRHWLSIDAGDLKHEGRDEIFATAFFDSVHRPRLVVLRLDNGTLKQVTEIEGLARAIDRADGSKTIAYQNLSRSRDLSFTAPAELTANKDTYKPGPWLKLKRVRDDQLFGYTLGDFDGDKKEDLALLERGENLRVFFDGTQWSEGGYGGSKDDFSLEGDVIGSVVPRMATRHTAAGKDQLLVLHNIPELGVRLTYLKLYKKSELTELAWNGLEMKPVWKLPIAGYLADFAVGDGLHDGTSQLWLATLNSGDKTVLICYSLP